MDSNFFIAFVVWVASRYFGMNILKDAQNKLSDEEKLALLDWSGKMNSKTQRLVVIGVGVVFLGLIFYSNIDKTVLILTFLPIFCLYMIIANVIYTKRIRTIIKDESYLAAYKKSAIIRTAGLVLFMFLLGYPFLIFPS